MQFTEELVTSIGASTPEKPPFLLGDVHWLADHEIQWLVEQYVHRYGFQFIRFGELSVVNTPTILGYDGSMIFFQYPVSLNNEFQSILTNYQPYRMLQTLWCSALSVNAKNPQLPSRFKVCFITNAVSNTYKTDAIDWLKKTFFGEESSCVEIADAMMSTRDNSSFTAGSHWFNLIYDFEGLNQEVLTAINDRIRGGQDTITLPKPEQNELGQDEKQLFLDNFHFEGLYRKLTITILDSIGQYNRFARAVAERITSFGFYGIDLQIRQLRVPFQSDISTCGDESSRNGVHFSFFGTVPEKKYQIRSHYLQWRQQAENTTVSLALLHGLTYRLCYLQPKNAVVMKMARAEMERVIKAYYKHLKEQIDATSSLSPLKLRRQQKRAALIELSLAFHKDVLLNTSITDIEKQHPKMFTALNKKQSFMRELVDVMINLQRFLLSERFEISEDMTDMATITY